MARRFFRNERVKMDWENESTPELDKKISDTVDSVTSNRGWYWDNETTITVICKNLSEEKWDRLYEVLRPLGIYEVMTATDMS